MPTLQTQTSCAPKTPIFWQRQPGLPIAVHKVLRSRLERALEDPSQRALLVWPTILGAPRLRSEHPLGVPEDLLMESARGMLNSLGCKDPEASFRATLTELPETAQPGSRGWLPHPDWREWADLVSLRSGVTLLALMGQPEGPRYRLAAGTALFNSALFHEAHDALEGLWIRARGHLKRGLQGLILQAGGFHHQQAHREPGMIALWENAMGILGQFDGELETPWGTLDFSSGMVAMGERLAWLATRDEEEELSQLWEFSRPTWDLLP